ncbi:hypothetical protein FQN57_004457 [Myotisia sp. PD_48]|nr:hypothetical protein FQN57_004457 [Myotisia sp. PD_48]
MTGQQATEALHTIFLDQPPSCLQSCPTATDFFVIGTYLLTKDGPETSASPESSRSGSLQLFKLNRQSFQIVRAQKIPLAHAVFDLQFCPEDASVFAVALSTAVVSLYRIETSIKDRELDVSMHFIENINVGDDMTRLSLYLAWIPAAHTNKTDSSTAGFAVSFSDGSAAICPRKNLQTSNINTEEPGTQICIEGTPIEVWCLAFDQKTNGQLSLFSGDDFNQVRELTMDSRMDPDLTTMSWQVNDRGKQHEAGVTFILPLCHIEGATILLTGSYDQFVRVYHYGQRKRVLASKDLDGGVWRLKLIKTERHADATSSNGQELGAKTSYLVLASCMHAGARIIRVDHSTFPEEGEDEWDIQVLTEFTEHTSMNYASDFFMSSAAQGDGEYDISNLLCVSSSFYDKRVCVWKPVL